MTIPVGFRRALLRSCDRHGGTPALPPSRLASFATESEAFSPFLLRTDVAKKFGADFSRNVPPASLAGGQIAEVWRRSRLLYSRRCSSSRRRGAAQRSKQWSDDPPCVTAFILGGGFFHVSVQHRYTALRPGRSYNQAERPSLVAALISRVLSLSSLSFPVCPRFFPTLGPARFFPSLFFLRSVSLRPANERTRGAFARERDSL